MAGSTALMRQAMLQVIHHIRKRAVFGAKLVDAPLMRNVVADLTHRLCATSSLI
jgi:putative acyl-CoA dehydrogenase